MNKSQLIDIVARDSGLKRKDSEAAVNAVIGALEQALVSGDKIQIVGFGSFEIKERAARKGRNPANGQEIDIPASKHISFSAGKALKDKINGLEEKADV